MKAFVFEKMNVLFHLFDFAYRTFQNDSNSFIVKNTVWCYKIENNKILLIYLLKCIRLNLNTELPPIYPMSLKEQRIDFIGRFENSTDKPK